MKLKWWCHLESGCVSSDWGLEQQYQVPHIQPLYSNAGRAQHQSRCFIHIPHQLTLSGRSLLAAVQPANRCFDFTLLAILFSAMLTCQVPWNSVNAIKSHCTWWPCMFLRWKHNVDCSQKTCNWSLQFLKYSVSSVCVNVTLFHSNQHYKNFYTLKKLL